MSPREKRILCYSEKSMGVFREKAEQYKKIWIAVMSLTAIGAMIAGAVGVIHSDLFLVRVVEVNDLPEVSPVEAQTIIDIAKVPTDSVNLFSLRLSSIEKRVMAHPWIRGVTISKRFPQTVSISVQFREPSAILQKPSGALYYLDQDGVAFAPIHLKSNPNLPVFVGMKDEQLSRALRFVKTWAENKLESSFTLSSLEFHPERGLRVMVVYPISGSAHSVGRVLVELGQEFDADVGPQLGRLREVMTYLSRNGILARHVFADLGKKIVVRIARSS